MTQDRELVERWHATFRHSAGRLGSRYLAALRDDGKILGSRTGTPPRVLVPPKDLGTDGEFVEVGPGASLLAFAPNEWLAAPSRRRRVRIGRAGWRRHTAVCPRPRSHTGDGHAPDRPFRRRDRSVVRTGMTKHAAILGSASLIARRFEKSLEFAVHETVLAALADAKLELDAIDTVVTAASDTLDGIMVATRSEIAGSTGRAYMHIPSSAGHALAAAATLIEAGMAQRVLLVGWGEGSKFLEQDSRGIQADPFFARPVGADPLTVAALQAQFLIAAGRIDTQAADKYARGMNERAWPGQEIVPGSVPIWLRTGWCDGAVALVLAKSAEYPAAVRIRDFATSFQPYTPQDLDPATWVADAIGPQTTPLDTIEISAPTPVCEARAGMALAGEVNASGGGAAAYFGIATGLKRIAAAASSLRAGQHAKAIDLAGPIGQAVTVVTLDRSATP